MHYPKSLLPGRCAGAIVPLLFVLFVGIPTSSAQNSAKEYFAGLQEAAVAEPYVGVATSDGIEPDLYSLRATGVSTASLVAAAERFLAALSTEQRSRTEFPVDDDEWRRWCNVDNGIYDRQGVSLREMDGPQREAARGLMAATLSAKGLALADAIRRTDQTLKELNPRFAEGLDEELYFFTVMGTPSSTAPWGWQIDGHHLVINTFVLGDQVVMTPAFWGGEPTVTTTGKYAGSTVLQEEQDRGLAFMRGLDEKQRAKATIEAEKTQDNLEVGAFADNAVLDYAGLRVDALSPDQRADLRELIGMFVRNQAEGHAAVRMAEVEQHLDRTYFAWIGTVADDAVFYYRIHSPVILIEFDHQRPVGTRSLHPAGEVTRDHIHAIVRTPNGNDYGRDLLRRHLEREHTPGHPHTH